MYVRIYLLGPKGRPPRAILFRVGSSKDNHTTYGFSPFRPRFIRWRHKLWTAEDEAQALALRERETLQRPW